jgi:N-acetylmuramoyl-L-alanine amidase
VTLPRARLAAFPLLFCCLGLTLADGPTPASRPAAPFAVVTSAGRRPLAVATAGDREMVALDDLASLFSFAVREDAVAGGVTVSCKGRTIALTPGQNVVSVAGRLVSLRSPVIRDGRRWLVPLEFMGRAVAPACEIRIDVRPASRLVVVGDARVPRVVVAVSGTVGGATVTLDLTPSTGHAVVQEPGRLLVRLQSDALDVALPSAGLPPLVPSVRVIDPANLLAIDLGPQFRSYRAVSHPAEGGERLVIDVFASLPDQVPLGQVPVPMPAPPPLAAAGTRTTIVLDPGHGGDETGARGPGGTLEKDVTLGVARRLKSAIEGRLGVRVLLTRDADQTLPPDDRTAVANNNKAAMFVSLHANAALRPEVRGVAVFQLSVETGQEGRQAPRQAIVPTLGGGSREIDVVPWEAAQTRFAAESTAMAEIFSQELQSRAAVGPRPIDRAPLRVLVGANMPAVLIELGYLSNPEEEQHLASEAYQDQLAQALLEAVVRFRTFLDQSRPPGGSAGLPIGGERRSR